MSLRDELQDHERGDRVPPAVDRGRETAGSKKKAHLIPPSPVSFLDAITGHL